MKPAEITHERRQPCHLHTIAQYQARAGLVVFATFTDPTGAALDLTSWNVEAQVWDLERTSKIADFVVSFPSGRAAGVVKFALTKLQTPALLDDSYYDVALTDTSGIKEFYLEGILPAEEGYTR